MKVHLVTAELFHVDRGTDGQLYIHDESKSRFSQFSGRA